MIRDLASQEGDVSLTTDVLVIGGGIAGLLLAARLRDRKRRVVVIESGDREQREDTHPLNRVVQLGDNYRGATHGRFRCLGGTSTRWGGALIPFVADDLLPRPYLDVPAWPIGIEAVLPHLADVEALFGIDRYSYEDDFVYAFGHGAPVPTGDADFVARFAKWPTFKRRNVARLLRHRINGDAGIEVWINATASFFDLDQGARRLRTVTALHPNGKTLTVGAAHTVLCAGAIESTRLLLLLDAQYDNRPLEGCHALGRYFHDHISAPVASIRACNVSRLNRLAGFRFSGSTMRSLRFELTPAVQRKEVVPSAFGHISFEPKGKSGFDALREFLRVLQRSGRFDRRSALQVLGDLPYLTKAAIWRAMRKQLYWPMPAEYALHVVAEQVPRFDNNISLASDRDSLGLRLAAIDWRVRSGDTRVFEVYRRRFSRFWTRHGLDCVGELEFVFDDSDTAGATPLGGGIYHPGGSTRMGRDGRSAIVDCDLRTFAVPNLWVASTSVFPSGASANPTLMLMLLTHRLAEHLATLRERH